MTITAALAMKNVEKNETGIVRDVPTTRRTPATPLALTDTTGSAGKVVEELAKMETWTASIGFRLGADKRTVSPSTFVSIDNAPGPATR